MEPDNYDDYFSDGIDLSFGESAIVTNTSWYLGSPNASTDDWGIAVELSGDYKFTSGDTTTVTIEVDGECIYEECDMWWGYVDALQF